MIAIERLDHLVLTVADIERTCAFYAEILGMAVETFGRGRKALRFGDQKINLPQAGREFEPKAEKPTPGSGDLCLLTKTPMAGNRPVKAAPLARRVCVTRCRRRRSQ